MSAPKNFCHDCKIEASDEYEFHRNSSDERICDGCAEGLPTFHTTYLPVIGKFYGAAENGEQEITTGFSDTESEARAEIESMSVKLWDAKPIEEN